MMDELELEQVGTGVDWAELERAGVSVVIPTVLRPELYRALDSVRRQTFTGEVQVVVVLDLPGDVDVGRLRNFLADGDVVVFTGGGRGAGYARNLGVQAAEGRWVAFLDDDDEWLAEKLESQLLLAETVRRPERTVVSSRAVYGNVASSAGSTPVPRQLIDGERVEDYLFFKRTPSVGRATLFTPTLLVSRRLAEEVAWATDLPRHQDWDWLVRLRRAGADIVQHPDVLVRVWPGSADSISSGADWQTSCHWVASQDDWSRRTRSDFIASVTLRYALQARSWTGVRTSIREISRTRRLPSLEASGSALIGVIPRRLINRLLAGWRRSARR